MELVLVTFFFFFLTEEDKALSKSGPAGDAQRCWEIPQIEFPSQPDIV